MTRRRASTPSGRASQDRRPIVGAFAATWLLLGALLTLASPACAALGQARLAEVRAAPGSHAQVGLDLAFSDQNGTPVRLSALLGNRPSLLLLADYRCTQLCGSMLGLAAQTLHATGLAAPRDFNLLLVDFNPDATLADGRAMRDRQTAAYPDLKAAARLLTASPQTLQTLEQDLGFTAVRDTAEDRYAHPADLYVLTPDGRVSRLLNALSLDPDTLRLALVEAGQGRIGSLVDRLHVLCYGLNPLAGASNGLAGRMLRIGAGLTLAAAGLVAAIGLRRRRAA